MTEQLGTAAQTVGHTLLWSSLGGAELVVGLVVGLMLLAFALPANLGRAENRDGASRPAGDFRHG